jgi:hypothetical protein
MMVVVTTAGFKDLKKKKKKTGVNKQKLVKDGKVKKKKKK